MTLPCQRCSGKGLVTTGYGGKTCPRCKGTGEMKK